MIAPLIGPLLQLWLVHPVLPAAAIVAGSMWGWGA